MSDIYTPSQLSIKDVLVPFESREQMLTFALSWFIRGFRDALPRTEHEWMDYGRLWAPLFHSFRIVVFLYCSLTAMEKWVYTGCRWVLASNRIKRHWRVHAGS